MRKLSTCVAAVSIFVAMAACGPKNHGEQAPSTPPANGAYPGYPPGQYPPGQYPQQGQYPQGQPPQTPYPQPTGTYGQPYPPPAPAPSPAPAPAPSDGAQMSVPGPVAFPCQSDVQCGTHHCNLQYGKCAYPCHSAADCISPNQCVVGLCVPMPPQAH